MKKSISIIISFSLLSSQTLLAIENIQTPPSPIIIDNSITPNNPTLDTSRNNIPVINIATPNDIGISNNYYKEFNVNESGVIFNNSKDPLVNTNLAGYINGNMNLKEKEASLILNQVSGNNLSQLLGFMEIAGKKADFILANPNGITCKGCGFINSSSTTLTTGKISLEELERLSNLKDLNTHLNIMVERGHINIEALNTSNIPTLNIIAKSLSVDKNLLANKLNIILGNNKVGMDLSKNASILLYEPIEIPTQDSHQYSSTNHKNDSKDFNSNDKDGQSDSNNKDKDGHNKQDHKSNQEDKHIALALDVAYLGSILAKSIYLVATTEGIGVKNSGRIATVASEKEGDGGFVINVNGKVEIAKPKEAYEAYKQEQERIKEQNNLSNNISDNNNSNIDNSNSNNTDDNNTSNSNNSKNVLASSDVNTSNNVSLSDSTSKNVDNPNNPTTLSPINDTFIPPSITSSSNLFISAKELENHSILSAKGNLEIKADTVNNLGSLELENVEVSRTHHYEKVGNGDYNTTYDYTKTITEERLKEGTYDPAIIGANNIHIEANHLTNDTAILSAADKLDLEVADLVNTQPISKRIEKKVGVKKVYDRVGGECGVWGLFSKLSWNCHSNTDTYSFTPAPIISSIPLLLPSVNTESLASSISDINNSTFFETLLAYKIETHPLYTSKDNFISTSSFQSFLHHTFLPAHPLEDITGIIDSINKNTQSFIDFQISHPAMASTNAMMKSNNIKPTTLSSALSDNNSNNDPLALNDTSSNNPNSTDQDTDSSISDEDDSSSSSTSKSKSSTSSSKKTTPSKTQTITAGIYGKDISIASNSVKNHSKVSGKDTVTINAKFLLNQNGEIVANHPASLADTSSKASVASSTHTGNLIIKGEVFKSVSSSLVAKNAYLNSNSTEIISATNSTEGSLYLSAPKGSLAFLLPKKPIYTSSETSLDALSSVYADNLYIKGEKVAFKGSDINATHQLNIDASTLDISTVKLSSSYSDDTQSRSSTTHLSSSLKAGDISINVAKDANLTSASLKAQNNINLTAGGAINLNSATNSSMSKVSTTEYSEKYAGLSSSTTTTTTTDTSNIHLANSMEANNLSINSNASINANNLTVNAKGKASINAKENISISNIADTFSHSKQTHQETKGFNFSSEGNDYSMSFGKDSSDISDKTSASIHHKQTIQASSISINANNKASIESSNLIANNGDIAISASDVSISSLKDTFTHQKDEKYTSNRVGISVPKSYVGELGKGAGKSALNGLGKGLQWVGEHLDPNNPNNTIVSNHPGLYSTPGQWLQKGSDKISSPSLSQINHLEVGVGFTHTDQSSHQLAFNMQNSSSDLIANNISISAKNKADISGSNLNAKNDINLAAKNLTITSSSDTASSSTSSTSNTLSAKLSANIGKDTSVSIEGKKEHSNKEDSTLAITQAASSLSSKNLHINTDEDTHIQGSNINATDTVSIAAKSFSLTSSENKLSTHHNDSSLTGSIKLSYNGTFGGEMDEHYDKNNTTTQTLTHNASSLNTNKLSITTSEDSNIMGSTIDAKEGSIQSKSLNILAVKDTSSSNSKSNTYSASIGVNLSNLPSSKLGGNMQQSPTTKDSTSYQNASLKIDNLSVSTQEDLNIKGGNIAANDVKANIKGNMNIESLQDSHSEKHKDFSLGASMENSHFKPSLKNSLANSSSSDVKNQSGITAHNSLQMNVEGNTDLKGAFINVEDKQSHQTFSTFTTHSLSSSDIINSSSTQSMGGMKGYKEEGNISKTLASISKNIDLKQDTSTNINRSTPTNETLKEATIDTTTTSQNSLFNTLVEIKDISNKASDLGHKAKATFKSESYTQGFKEFTKQALKDTDKGIDLAYSDVKPIVSSLAEVSGNDDVKKVGNDINNYISLTHNTKEMGKGSMKVFSQSFKEDVKGAYNFVKPLSDSLLDIGWKNTTDMLGNFIGDKGEGAKDNKTIFNNAWDNTKKQSNEAINRFKHKMLWE